MQKPLKTSMRRTVLICSVLVSALLIGCYGYSALRLTRKADFSALSLHSGIAGGAAEGGVSKVAIHSPNAPAGRTQKLVLIRYLAKSWSLAPYSRANYMGVRYALEGRFREAETMFREALKENDRFAPASNNLGVVYEIFGRIEESFQLYSRACLLEPGNDVFRENFLGLSDSAVK